MTEARQQNTEIRMAVSKVADKMDHLAAKVKRPDVKERENASCTPTKHSLRNPLLKSFKVLHLACKWYGNLMKIPPL